MKIVGTKKSGKKHFNADTEDHCISKHARITPAVSSVLPIQSINGKSSAHCKVILQADKYEIVDLKVKIIVTKFQGICNEKSIVYAKDR